MPTYRAKARCSNCRWRGILVIAQGVPVANLTCPRCGTISLEPQGTPKR